MNIFLNNQVASAYDEYYQSEFGKQVDAIEKHIIKNLLIELPQGPLLELGCGTGHWTSFFQEAGFKVIATDVSEAMMEIARQKLPESEILYADVEELPFDDSSFDAITSITMLEFVDDQEKAIKEIYRVLKPGGLFLLGCLNANSVLGKNKDNDEVFKHAKLFTVDSISAKFTEFERVEINTGVYLNEQYQLLDHADEANIEPVFIGVLFKK